MKSHLALLLQTSPAHLKKWITVLLQQHHITAQHNISINFYSKCPQPHRKAMYKKKREHIRNIVQDLEVPGCNVACTDAPILLTASILKRTSSCGHTSSNVTLDLQLPNQNANIPPPPWKAKPIPFTLNFTNNLFSPTSLHIVKVHTNVYQLETETTGPQNIFKLEGQSCKNWAYISVVNWAVPLHNACMIIRTFAYYIYKRI